MGSPCTLSFTQTFMPEAEPAPNELFQNTEDGYDPSVELVVIAPNVEGKNLRQTYVFRARKGEEINTEPVEIKVASSWSSARIFLQTQKGPCSSILATKNIKNNAYDGSNQAFEITFGSSKGKLTGQIDYARN